MSEPDDTHETKLVGTTDCPNDDCDGQATTWWEVPLDPEVGEEIYRISCPICGHQETY